MSDKNSVHRGSSFRGLFSPRAVQTPATPLPVHTAPTFPVHRLPADILGAIVGFLREQSAQDFVCDMHSLLLVSRGAAAAVKGFDATEIGEILQSAAQEYAPKRAFAEAAGLLKQKKPTGWAKLFGERSHTTPPPKLVKLAKNCSRIELTLDASRTDDAVLDALLQWGEKLPLQSIRISCGARDRQHVSSSAQIVEHIKLATTVLCLVGLVPHKNLSNIEIDIVGTGETDYTKIEQREMARAIEILALATARVSIFCYLTGTGIPKRLQADLDEARQDNLERMMRVIGLKRLRQ